MTTPQDRQLLINRLELFSRKHPKAYRFRVMLVAALGYAYLFFIVASLLAAVGFVIWLMVSAGRIEWRIFIYLWIPVALAGLILRSMWINVPAPDGKEVQREQAPRLFELIAEVRTAVAGPEVHQVLLSDEFNVRVVQVPRFGMFGWLRNYLVVGLPLLKAIAPDEFRAVIAHEFGHLSSKLGWFSGWIYHLRGSWIQILTRFEQPRQYVSFVFDLFIRWYGPYFDAYSFVLARAQEYEADRYAAKIAGKAVAVRALLQMEGKVRAFQEDLWPNFYRQARDQPEPPANPFGLMLAELQQPLAPLKVERRLRQSLGVETGYDDTHPALAERLERIGFSRTAQANDSLMLALDSENRSKESAANHFLKEVPADVTDSYNRSWREQVVSTWKQTHEYVQEARERLAQWEASSAERPLTIAEHWERADCTATVKDAEAALPIVREILQLDPSHAGANRTLGAILLDQQDSAGVDYLEKAIQLDSWLSADAYALIYNFYQGQGKSTEAETYRTRARASYERLGRLHEQALNVTTHDPFAPHGLDDVALKRLQERLAKTRGLWAACLVRKILDGHEWAYVLAVQAAYTWKDGQNQKCVGDLINELATEIDLGRMTVFVSLDLKPFLVDPLARVPNSLVYRQEWGAGLKTSISTTS